MARGWIRTSVIFEGIKGRDDCGNVIVPQQNIDNEQWLELIQWLVDFVERTQVKWKQNYETASGHWVTLKQKLWWVDPKSSGREEEHGCFLYLWATVVKLLAPLPILGIAIVKPSTLPLHEWLTDTLQLGGCNFKPVSIDHCTCISIRDYTVGYQQSHIFNFAQENTGQVDICNTWLSAQLVKTCQIPF